MAKQKLILTEEEILSTIERVIKENRKVLKVGGGSEPSPAPVAPAQPMQQPMGVDMGGDAENQGAFPAADANVNNGASEPNQFDSNFDAGVEADEDADPKHYIQQLTGKLSQSLNSFNNEQGGDEGLNKYVAGMIVKAACKFLDDKDKKDIISKINSTSAEDEDSLENTGDGTEIAPEEQGDMNFNGGMQESRYTKSEFDKILAEMMNDCNPMNSEHEESPVKGESNNEKVKTPFSSKQFK